MYISATKNYTIRHLFANYLFFIVTINPNNTIYTKYIIKVVKYIYIITVFVVLPFIIINIVNNEYYLNKKSD